MVAIADAEGLLHLAVVVVVVIVVAVFFWRAKISKTALFEATDRPSSVLSHATDRRRRPSIIHITQLPTKDEK